ncbi:MAG: response regulator transcription factor [Ekhidna sp.]|nr:response regulator transcription factor [Ekhidna sp.]
MTKIKLLIVDDEHLAQKVLQKHAANIEYLEVVGTCFDSISTINFLNNQQVDAILLDIQMPDLTGLELVETLEKNCPKIIFTTAYTEYALESFNYEAVIDYLHKPIRLTRFIKAMERLKKQLELEQSVLLPEQANVQTAADVSKDFLNVKDNKVIHKIFYEQILYLQSWGNYIKIFTDDENVRMARMTIKELEDLLPKEYFERIHKSYIVNVKKVSGLDGNRAIIDGNLIPIGKSYLGTAKKKLMG